MNPDFSSTQKPKTKIGDIFGWLTITERHSIDKDGAIKWCCVCICGNYKIVRGYHLTRGNCISCGCFSAQNKIKASITYLEKFGYKVTKI